MDLEWQVENKEGSGLTGFILEHVWLSERPGRRDGGNASEEGRAERIGPVVWYRSIIQDPEARSHTIGRLTPTVTYQFRITSVNHRTVGHASAAKTPGTMSRETKCDETPFVKYEQNCCGLYSKIPCMSAAAFWSYFINFPRECVAGELGAHPVVWTFFSVVKITGLILFCFPLFVIHTGERRTINSTRNICTTDRLIHSTPFISTCFFCPFYFLSTTSSSSCSLVRPPVN